MPESRNMMKMRGVTFNYKALHKKKMLITFHLKTKISSAECNLFYG